MTFFADRFPNIVMTIFAPYCIVSEGNGMEHGQAEYQARRVQRSGPGQFSLLSADIRPET
jgi:hypothetical protein